MGEERVFFSPHFQEAVNPRGKSGKELRPERKPGQELRHRGRDRGLLTDVLSAAFSTPFLANARIGSPGMAPLSMEALPRQSLIKRMLYRLGVSSVQNPTSQICLCLCQIDQNKTKPHQHTSFDLGHYSRLLPSFSLHLSSGVPGRAWAPPLNSENNLFMLSVHLCTKGFPLCSASRLHP